MEYVFAALLLHKLNKDITEDNVVNVIKATGVTPDQVKVKALVAALSEVNIEEALKAAPMPHCNLQARFWPRQHQLQIKKRKKRRKKRKKKKHLKDYPPYSDNQSKMSSIPLKYLFLVLM